MKYIVIIILLIVILYGGCEPISVNKPPAINNVVADVLAFVSPDTVQQDMPFIVQVGYPNVCGGTFKQMYVTQDTLNHIYFQPIIHQVQQDACPAVVEYITLSETLSVNQAGTYELVAIGNYGSFRKIIEVVPSHIPHQSFKFHYFFQNRHGAPVANRVYDMSFANQQPNQFFTITADSYGDWDTTFTSATSPFTYTVGGFTFHASEGITEDGIIIIP